MINRSGKSEIMEYLLNLYSEQEFKLKGSEIQYTSFDEYKNISDTEYERLLKTIGIKYEEK